MHYCTAGDGGITVLFEAGLGKSRSTWSLVQPQLTDSARTVVYDRAGYGRSDPAPEPRTFEALLTDHLQVLDDVVDTPCILVGHSYGGPIVRRAALARPEKVKGVVLVDEVPEIAGATLIDRSMGGATAFYRAQVALARVGLLSAAHRRTYFRRLTGSALREAVDESGTVRAARTALAEWKQMIPGVKRLEATGPHFPRVPLTEITADRNGGSEPRADDFLYRAHHDIAEAAGGRHVVATSSSHDIQLTEPRLVVEETLRMIDVVSST
ncbi:alpha/beta fold hydrolase [Rhodococcus sp. BP-349]|nr:alpha/beta fold hydrolase [Rhodococcus sp. BP-363]MBY6543851.1 alpha/beta fold hydrolase [Rhodococcus sp. BP-369]MBY6563081.1 alpha/beta fold hydrolase [Rhodococcus sp. BP-370]MBY6577373.1 alpha/beta fold hydrolase [Rhodococcus sp. BP-364]MBY6586674.1 alpha/beta fold hydrolase [Rhodococcus sp. BP-358]MBY6591011.1 alpha/beta fold hydrolase [Rhodococcus sp. BP-362]MBY6595655.1 alpha/beta fold hydrolase [Rhodococcus sp. BP-359]MBY6599994.1 alpha/beta fold hydrolase [Rhodococcus sp. BP-353]M